MQRKDESRSELRHDRLRKLLRAARDLLAGVERTSGPNIAMGEAFKLDVVGVWGLPPEVYGIGTASHERPDGPPGDLAVLRRYQNGWGKAESDEGASHLTEMPSARDRNVDSFGRKAACDCSVEAVLKSSHAQ